MPLLLFLIGAAATIILLVLFAYAPDLRGDITNGSNAVSRSAIGFAGLKRLMELSGHSHSHRSRRHHRRKDAKPDHPHSHRLHHPARTGKTMTNKARC